MNIKTVKQAIVIAGLALSLPSLAVAQADDPHHPPTGQGAPTVAPTPPAAQPGGQTQGMPMPMGQGGTTLMQQGGMMSMMGEMMKMMGGMAGGQPKGDAGPASQAFNGLMQRMHQDMQMTWSGNADVDFMKAMIPHHQGAIDMATVVVAFGKDPVVRKLAEAVIKSQEAEVATMKAWLAAQKK